MRKLQALVVAFIGAILVLGLSPVSAHAASKAKNPQVVSISAHMASIEYCRPVIVDGGDIGDPNCTFKINPAKIKVKVKNVKKGTALKFQYYRNGEWLTRKVVRVKDKKKVNYTLTQAPLGRNRVVIVPVKGKKVVSRSVMLLGAR